jgi:hypothetical protein
MADFSDTQSAGAEKDKLIPRTILLTMFRLGVFQMGLGMMSVLTLGVINRVMIDAGVEKKYRSIWGGCCLTRRCYNTGWCSPGKPVEWLWQFGCGGG